MNTLRLAFVLPALIAVTPAVAAPHSVRVLRPALVAAHVHSIRAARVEAPLRYVTLDRMIKGFCVEALAAVDVERATLIAQR